MGHILQVVRNALGALQNLLQFFTAGPDLFAPFHAQPLNAAQRATGIRLQRREGAPCLDKEGTAFIQSGVELVPNTRQLPSRVRLREVSDSRVTTAFSSDAFQGNCSTAFLACWKSEGFEGISVTESLSSLEWRNVTGSVG